MSRFVDGTEYIYTAVSSLKMHVSPLFPLTPFRTLTNNALTTLPAGLFENVGSGLSLQEL